MNTFTQQFRQRGTKVRTQGFLNIQDVIAWQGVPPLEEENASSAPPSFKKGRQDSSNGLGRRFLLLLAGAGMLCMQPLSPAHAEDITWEGPGQLVSNPFAIGPFAPYVNALKPAVDYSGNTVTITGGPTLTKSFVYGGYSTVTGAQVQNNTVSVTGGEVDGLVLGGMMTGVGDVLGNTVTIGGDAIAEEVFGGFIFGSGEALNNTVYIQDDAEVSGSVTGASGVTKASGNAVYVSGGSIGGAVVGAVATTGDATNNLVSISGGEVGDPSAVITAARTTSGNARYNTILISGGEIKADIVGGLLYHSSGSIGSPTSEAIGNTIQLSGSPDLYNAGAPVNIYGGQSYLPGFAGDAYSDNKLVLWNYSGSAVGDINNFQKYDFFLPASLENGDILLSAGVVNLDPDASSAPAAQGKQSRILAIDSMGGGTALGAGDSVTLISATALNGTPENDGQIVHGQKGISLLYDYLLSKTGNSLVATVQGDPSVNPRTKALAEGRIAGMAFVNQGADLIAGPGMDAARRTVQGKEGGLMAFVAAQGGTSKYDTGSHVDVDGISMMAGLAWNAETEQGNLLLGAFFESGWGNYDSHNSFSNYASVKGDGDTEYYGGGLLGRFDFSPTGPGNIYTEASFRAGWTDTDFSSSDLRDRTGRKADYDSGSAYYGLHVGLGYIWGITESSNLDIYTKYFWMHQDSDSVTVVDDPVKFKAQDSHRWRAGARFSHDLTTDSGLTFTPYIGAAYEYEFDGKAKATTYGRSIDAPDLKGSVGMGELGFTLKPLAEKSLSFDLGVQGYTGVREGVTGSFQMKLEF